MPAMSNTAAASKLRAMITGADDLVIIQNLEGLIGMSGKGDAERYTTDLLVDELADRFPQVEEALTAWEFDLDTEESSAQVAVRVAREVLGL